jgi:hypothetical protein
VRKLLLDRLFVPLREGIYLTRALGLFGPWRRITGEQKERLSKLYRCTIEGIALLAALGLYRTIFGGNVDYDDLFNGTGFAFGLTVFMTQTWLLGDSPEVSGPRQQAGEVKRRPSTQPSDFTHATVVFAAFLSSAAVLAVGLILHDTTLSVGGFAGGVVSGLLVRRIVLRLWRSRR